MANTVVGFFDNTADAQQAVARLVEAGVDHDRIDVSSGRAGTGGASESRQDDAVLGGSSVAEKGEQTGNAISRFFHSLFSDDASEATRYSRVAESANTIVTVHAKSSDEAEDAADILDEAGAVDVNEKAAYYGQGAQTSSSPKMNAGENETKIDRVEEELQVGKRSVQTGGVRVRSRIVERPVEEQLRLREEHVTVDRTAVNRTLSESDYAAFQEQDIELTEYAEVPVVNKEARVVEEIRVGKSATEREETVRDTVRKTEVDIENVASKNEGTTSADSWKNTGREGNEDRL